MTSDFSTVSEFYNFLDRDKGYPAPSKIFGKVEPGKNRPTASALRYSYEKTVDPNVDSIPARTLFGEMRRAKMVLDPMLIYSADVFDDHDKLYQGDLFFFDMSPYAYFQHCSGVVLVSQTCDMDKERNTTVLAAPFYIDDDLPSKSCLTTWNQGFANRDSVERYFNNGSLKYVGMPSFNSNRDSCDRFLIILGGISPISVTLFDSKIPSIRLTYRGLAYLQMRLFTFFMRDVERSDDMRAF